MSYIAPNTRVKLLKGCNIPSDGKHTLYFASKSAQTSFFEGLNAVTFTEYSFQRGTDGTDKIRVGASYGSLYGCSYMLFNNSSYLDKNFYAFITDIRYVNNEVCDVYYRIDNLQTWMFDITLLPSYVERTMDDGTGRGLLTDEGLPCGEMEYRYDTSVEIDNFPLVSSIDGTTIVDSRFCVLIQATIDLEKANSNLYPANADLNDYQISAIYVRDDSSMIDAVGLFMIPINVLSWANPLDSFVRVYNWIMKNGFTDSIIQMWIYPTCLISAIQKYATHLPANDVFTVTGVRSDTVVIDVSLPTRPGTVQGITVKNDKLLRYPYTQIIVTNNNGSGVSYRFEDFIDPDNPTARILGTTTAEGKIRLVPINYGPGMNTSFDYDSSQALDSAPCPAVSYMNDPYSVWLAQNRNTIENNFDVMEKQFVRGQVGAAANILSGGVMGKVGGKSQLGAAGVGSVIGGIAGMLGGRASAIENLDSIVAESEDTRNRPRTASGIQSTGLAAQNRKKYFTAGVIQPRPDRVKQLDDYFSMFGYRQDKIMAINLHCRTKWTYIKTAGCQIRSNIPKDIETEIASQFDSGIWFWSDNATMCDFSQNNGFLS